MTPDEREKFAVLVEKRLAGLLDPAETDELSSFLETSEEARQLYFRAVELHLDLGSAAVQEPAARPPSPDQRQEVHPMARIALNCSCSWNFFIPGSTTGFEVVCPSCGQAVRIPGRTPGKDLPRSAGAVAAENERRQQILRFAVGAAAAAVLVGVGLFVFSPSVRAPRDPGTDEAPLIAQPNVPPKPHVPDVTPPPPPPRPLPAVTFNPLQIQELRHDVYANVWLSNMSVLLSECMRYRNMTNEWGQFQADSARYDGKVKSGLGELAKVGEKLALETYLQQGDQIVGFAEKDFSILKPGDVATSLATWIQNWRAGPTLTQVNLIRGDQKMTIYVEFPEETKELLTLVRHPALGELNTYGADIVGVPPELLKDIKSRFDELPPGYRNFLSPADGKRLDELLRTRRGSSNEVEWLRSKLLAESLPSFQREADAIRSKILELEPKLKENTASDVVIFKEGRRIEGQIVQETETFVKLRSRFGAITIQREEIARIEKGKGAGTEFPAKYADAKGNLDKLDPLLAWCTEKGLKLEKDYVAYSILTLDASNEKARSAVGLSRPAIGPKLGPRR
jgi:hypothetical protein